MTALTNIEPPTLTAVAVAAPAKAPYAPAAMPPVYYAATITATDKTTFRGLEPPPPPPCGKQRKARWSVILGQIFQYCRNKGSPFKKQIKGRFCGLTLYSVAISDTLICFGQQKTSLCARLKGFCILTICICVHLLRMFF